MLSERVRVEATRNGQLAARLGMQVTDCPFDLSRSPVHRALAAIWVRGYLAARPPLPDEIRYDQ